MPFSSHLLMRLSRLEMIVVAEKENGIDPKTGRKVIARIGRYSALVRVERRTTDRSKSLFLPPYLPPSPL